MVDDRELDHSNGNTVRWRLRALESRMKGAEERIDEIRNLNLKLWAGLVTAIIVMVATAAANVMIMLAIGG